MVLFETIWNEAVAIGIDGIEKVVPAQVEFIGERKKFRMKISISAYDDESIIGKMSDELRSRGQKMGDDHGSEMSNERIPHRESVAAVVFTETSQIDHGDGPEVHSLDSAFDLLIDLNAPGEAGELRGMNRRIGLEIGGGTVEGLHPNQADDIIAHDQNRGRQIAVGARGCQENGFGEGRFG